MPKAQEPWRVRVWREFHVANLTRASRDVLLTLASYRGAGGLIYPSHATLAARVGCSVRTVQRALTQAAQLGLVRWAERRLRVAWRFLRTTNRYWLTTPDEPVAAGRRTPRVAEPTKRHSDRGEEIYSSKKVLQDMLKAAAALPDLLTMRRVAFQVGRYTSSIST